MDSSLKGGTDETAVRSVDSIIIYLRTYRMLDKRCGSYFEINP